MKRDFPYTLCTEAFGLFRAIWFLYNLVNHKVNPQNTERYSKDMTSTFIVIENNNKKKFRKWILIKT